jgi:hypothetical protein
MRKGARAALVAALLIFSVMSGSAYADAQPSPAPSAPTQLDAYKMALEQFKQQRDLYNQAMRNREEQIRAINQTFNLAVNKASQDARTAMQITTGPEQKSAATNAKRSAIANAIIARENAISALGQPPLPPVEPTRPQNNMPIMKDNGGGKNRR